MKFVLAENYTYWWPVKVIVPDEDKAGATVEMTFEGAFRALASDRLKALRNASKGEDAEALIRESLIDWRDVETPEGEEEPFSPEALTRALRFAFFRDGVIVAIFESNSGGAARKN